MSLRAQQRSESGDGTVHYGFTHSSGHAYEAVVIPNRSTSRDTVCVSSQTGCSMGCAFCFTATRTMRHLTSDEIVGQVRAVVEDRPDPRSVRNVVFMGMGEPLHNFESVCDAIACLTDTSGLDFSRRRITVSTVGWAPRIVELGQRCSVLLAVSLHAANDSLRDQLVPINRRWGLSTLKDAVQAYAAPSGARTMFEYTMLDGVNDTLAHAVELAEWVDDLPHKINLIPFNTFSGTAFRPSSEKAVLTFADTLRARGCMVTVRQPRGRAKQAACGQLGQFRSP